MLNLPGNLEGVKIEYLGKSPSLDFKEKHTIRFSYNDLVIEEEVSLPVIKDNEDYLLDDQYYYPIPCLAKPIVIIDKENHIITLKNILTDYLNGYDYDVSMRKLSNGELMCSSQGNNHFRNLRSYEYQRFVMRESDRKQLNEFLGTNGKSYRLESSDIERVEEILFDEWESVQTTDWKDFKNMRLCLLPEMLSMVISMTIPRVIRNFKETGQIQKGLLERACRKYMSDSSQCQIDLEETDFGQMALQRKLALPINQYDGENAADPHSTWFGYIDSVTTPQSEKCGQVVSLCDNVFVSNNKLVRINREGELSQIYSSALRKSVTFPQNLKTHRQVMCGAISKQGCALGKDGEYNQEQIVKTANCEHIPKIPGRIVKLAIMDWNLYTHEDACVISESLAEKLVTYRHVTTTFIDANGEMNIEIGEGEDVTSYHLIGTHNNGDPMRLTNQTAGKIIGQSSWEDEYKGSKVYYNQTTIESEYKCYVGSKLSNLHSCKSIVSKILPDERMPCDENGDPVEMMISPMSIGNRVNPSLIMEGMLGTYCVETGKILEFDQFDTSVTFKWAAKLLDDIGLPHDCQFQLWNGSKGKQFEYKTFVGNVFLMRLHHHVNEKLTYQNKTIFDHHGNVAKGRGNVRYGREELEILEQHGAKGVINEMIENSSKSKSVTTIQNLLESIGYKYEVS